MAMGSFPHSQVEPKHSVLCHGKKFLIHDCKDQAKLEDSSEVFEWSAAKKVLETTYEHRWHILPTLKKVNHEV